MEFNMTHYVFDCIRDLHKAARGVRPSAEWDAWFTALPAEAKQEVWNDLVAESNQRDAEEAREEQWHCRQFRDTIRATMRAGAPSVDDALRWMADGLKPYSVQDIEHWVWDHGILFTPLGKAVVERLDAMTDYQEV
tara:strand:+ start:98 stop:505 length:408 start_codon:yes stop_codon:yes gene_type:complete